jgi:hypothetical protein
MGDGPSGYAGVISLSFWFSNCHWAEFLLVLGSPCVSHLSHLAKNREAVIIRWGIRPHILETDRGSARIQTSTFTSYMDTTSKSKEDKNPTF